MYATDQPRWFWSDSDQIYRVAISEDMDRSDWLYQNWIRNDFCWTPVSMFVSSIYNRWEFSVLDMGLFDSFYSYILFLLLFRVDRTINICVSFYIFIFTYALPLPPRARSSQHQQGLLSTGEVIQVCHS